MLSSIRVKIYKYITEIHIEGQEETVHKKANRTTECVHFIRLLDLQLRRRFYSRIKFRHCQKTPENFLVLIQGKIMVAWFPCFQN